MPSPGHWNAPYHPNQPKLLDDLPAEILLNLVEFLEPDPCPQPRVLFLEDLRQLSLASRKLRRATFAALFREVSLSHVNTAQPLPVYGERIDRFLACTPVLKTARHLNIEVDTTRVIRNPSYGNSPAMRERSGELIECARGLLKVLKARSSTLKRLLVKLKGARILRRHYSQEFARCKIDFPALKALTIGAGSPVTLISSSPNLKRLEFDANSNGFSYNEVLSEFRIALEHMKKLPWLEYLGLHNVRENRIVRELGYRCQWLNELAKLPNIKELFLPEPSSLNLNSDRDEETPPLFSRIRTSYINKTIRRGVTEGLCRDTYVAARYAFAFLPRLEKLWVGAENLDNNGQAYTRLWLRKSELYFQTKIKDIHGINIKDINQLNSATDFWLRRI